MTARQRGRPLGPLGGHTAGDRGASPIEFAIIAAPLIMVVFMVVQAGLVYFANSVALGAATQGVNAERGYHAAPGAGAASARDFLAAAGAGLNDQQVSVNRGGGQVRVTVTGTAITVLPGVSFSISRAAHGPIERVTQP